MSDVIFFWRPSQCDVYSRLSPWDMTPFSARGVWYTCAEQYMVAQKAILFNDHDSAVRVMETDDPCEMHAIGRSIRNFDQRLWDFRKRETAVMANMAKFTEPLNSALRDILLSTDGRMIAYADPNDTVWGIGFGMSDAIGSTPADWQGDNLLGKVLMDVRENIVSHDTKYQIY